METKTKQKSKFSKKFLPLFLVAALLISAAFAFLTAHDSLNNHFSLSTLKITVLEPSFPSSLSTDVQPGMTIAKDPSVLNGTVGSAIDPNEIVGSGTNAFVYVAIKMPVTNTPYFVEDANETTGWKYINNGGKQDVFDLQYNNANGVNTTDWTLLGTDNSTLNENYRTYYFAYKNAVASGAETSKIFDHVHMKNFADRYYNEYDAVATYLDKYIHANFSQFQSNVSNYNACIRPDAGNNGTLVDPDFESSAYLAYKASHQNDAGYQNLDGTLNESKMKVDWYLSVSGYSFDDILSATNQIENGKHKGVEYTVVEEGEVGVNNTSTYTYVSGNKFAYDFLIGGYISDNNDVFGSNDEPAPLAKWLPRQGFVVQQVLSGTVKHLVVTGYAIQSDNLPEGIDTPAEAWPILINQTSALSNETPGNTTTAAQGGNG